MDAREDKIRELKLQTETARESEGKHIALVHSLRQKLCEYEASHGSLEGAASRSEVAIQTLQLNNKESHERIMELDSRLRWVYKQNTEYDQIYFVNKVNIKIVK